MSIYPYSLPLAFVAAGLLLTTCPALADFSVVKSPSPAAPQTATAAAPPMMMAPIVDPQDRAQAMALATKSAHPAPIHWRVASGFGNNVPLGFACKQIVPSSVKVTYGRGVNPNTLVTWHGGRGWNQVLKAAVSPVGLKLVMTRMAVEIRK